MVLPGEQFKNNTPAGLVEDTTTYTLLGYGCIRHDNTGGAMIGPLYAKSGSVCEVILRELIERFNLSPGGKYSVMSLTSNERADKLLRQIGLQEMDQCSRMFTKFIPEASLDQIYYVHSPNFTLF
uniref:YitH/HolE acetyltransferase (GNAT) domain-containing protein n=1 Tax=Aceria tosichella TaxID=561515 RepID=A0A6G1S7S9_9ACAR